jgi:hypothetical protein
VAAPYGKPPSDTSALGPASLVVRHGDRSPSLHDRRLTNPEPLCFTQPTVPARAFGYYRYHGFTESVSVEFGVAQ